MTATTALRLRLPSGLALALLMLLVAGARAADAPTSSAMSDAVERGAAFLIGQQHGDGSWEDHVGLTSMAVMALLNVSDARTAPARAAASRGLAYVERWVRPDGGIYQDDIRYYTTAVGLLAMVASGETRYGDRVLAARRYLMQLQAREETGFAPGHPLYGGTLVSADKANLDATFFAMRAIAAAGLPKSDPYWARAARFVTRCQNLRSSNDQPWAGDDGGFVFAPGFSFAGATRSYGSMTYAGLGAYWAAAIPRNDPRVEAALAWIRSNFTAAANPGLDRQALYHSFYYMSHTLSRWGIEHFHDGAGQPRAWRAELGAALLARQSADGSWANADDPRWLESRPVLATSFALTALNEIAGRRP